MSHYGASSSHPIISSSDDSSSTDIDEEFVELIMFQLMLDYENFFYDKVLCRISLLGGKMYTMEVLAGNNSRC